jgi:hypothetical protein
MANYFSVAQRDLADPPKAAPDAGFAAPPRGLSHFVCDHRH